MIDLSQIENIFSDNMNELHRNHTQNYIHALFQSVQAVNISYPCKYSCQALQKK